MKYYKRSYKGAHLQSSVIRPFLNRPRRHREVWGTNSIARVPEQLRQSCLWFPPICQWWDSRKTSPPPQSIFEATQRNVRESLVEEDPMQPIQLPLQNIMLIGKIRC